MLNIVIFDNTKIISTSLHIAWYPNFVVSKIFSAHTQFGEPLGCQNQGPKDIPPSHKKNTHFFKRIIRCIYYETSCYPWFNRKQKEYYYKLKNFRQ